MKTTWYNPRASARTIVPSVVLCSLAACGQTPPVPDAISTVVVPTLVSAVETALPQPTATATPSPTPTRTPTPTSTPTPHPEILAHTIEGLRARKYEGGQIKITGTITTTNAYRRVLITYPSDGLTISGMMHVPFGKGPFPVVILNHGYIPPSQYVTGSDTYRAADYLARRGYLTISPDFRGYARSDSGLNLYRAGYMIDALNAAASVKSLPNADPKRIGMWGHSMGGGVTTRAMVVSDLVKAAVLYAPVSANFRDRGYFYAFGGGSGISVPSDLFDSVYYWTRDQALIDQLSPINYFRYVTAPVSIHIGIADTTTPPRWSEAIRDALLAENKSVEYFEYPRQGHAFSGASWIQFNDRVVKFFNKYLR